MTPAAPVSIEFLVHRFIESKRTLGRKYHSESRELQLFVRCLQERGVTELEQVTSAILDEFLASRPRKRARSFNHLLGVVRCLFGWAVAQRYLEASPVQTQSRRATARRVPFLFDTASAQTLLDAAAALPARPKGPQRGPTYYTIFALLYGLGLRVGEVCGLVCSDVDVDRDLLVVRGGKFGKERLVPSARESPCSWAGNSSAVGRATRELPKSRLHSSRSMDGPAFIPGP